jgi:hypothetical protein
MPKRKHQIPSGGPEATARALERVDAARSVVLVEGLSDELALDALGRLRGVDLEAERVAILPIGGAHAVGRFAARFPHARVGGLCDAGEQDLFRRAGIADDALFVCRRDLEDELIRAHGPDRIELLLEENGDLRAFRTFQKQPAWRGRPPADQLRRFLTSADRRKLRYARILVSALDPAVAPEPLVAALDYALSPGVTTPAS